MLNKYLSFLCLALILSMLNNSLILSDALKYSIYVLLIVFIIWLYNVVGAYKSLAFRNRYLLILLAFICGNFAFSPYAPQYSMLLKFFSYVLCFLFGEKVFYERIPLKVNKILLYITILSPLILVGLFDSTPHKTTFFVLSNMYSFTGLSICLLYFTFNQQKRSIFYLSILLLLLYVISCSSLGIIVALLLCVLYVNRRNARLMLLSLCLVIFLFLAVMYSNLGVFVRIRDVINIFASMTVDDWANLKDLDLYTLQQQVAQNSSRNDNTSAIWRMAHWSALLEDFLKNWQYSFLFGLGTDYTYKELGNYPHNEYLRFLCEFGIIVFLILIRWVKKICRVMGGDRVFYFIGTFFFYCLTENLIDTFVGEAVLFFCIGYHYCRCKSGNIHPLLLRVK